MNKLAILFAAFIAITIADEEIEYVAKINNAQNSWKAGQNEISQKGIQYFRHLLGTKFHNGERLNNKEDIEIAESIPDTFDARTQWPNCASISSIKNQGECGSCWAVAAAAAASDRLCITSKFKIRVNISAENLLACCSDCVVDGGCNGGYPDEAWKYLQHTGLVTGGDYKSQEGCQPYAIEPTSTQNTYTPPCYKKCTNKKYGGSFRKDKHYSKTSYSLPQNVKAIQSDILKNGPVEAAFEVYNDFMYYVSGIYKRTSDQYLGGHAVRVIGWGTENSVPYWLVANSWGRLWGEDGTFRILRGSNECEFEENMTAGLLKK